MKRLLFALGLGAVALACGCNRPYYNGYYQQPYAPTYPAATYAPQQQQYAPAGGCAPVYNGGVQPTYLPAGTVPGAVGAPMSSVAPTGLQPVAQYQPAPQYQAVAQPVTQYQPAPQYQPVAQYMPVAATPAFTPTYTAPGAAPMY